MTPGERKAAEQREEMAKAPPTATAVPEAIRKAAKVRTPESEPSAASGGEIPWHVTPAGVRRKARELRVEEIPGEAWEDFVARVAADCADEEPGPWIDELPPAIRRKVNTLRGVTNREPQQEGADP